MRSKIYYILKSNNQLRGEDINKYRKDMSISFSNYKTDGNIMKIHFSQALKYWIQRKHMGNNALVTINKFLRQKHLKSTIK